MELIRLSTGRRARRNASRKARAVLTARVEWSD